MAEKYPWSGAFEKLVIAVVGVAAGLIFRASNGEVWLTPSWPYLWWMFLVGALLTAFIFHGVFVWRRDKWLSERVGVPRLWIEQARMEVVPREPYQALRLEVDSSGMPWPDFKLLSVELSTSEVGFAQPLLYLDHNNSEFDTHKQTLIVRPRDSAKLAFQLFANSVRSGHGVRVKIIDANKTISVASGLVYEARDQ